MCPAFSASMQHIATHCNTLQHTATHCNTLQYTATPCNTLQHLTRHCNTLSYTTTHVILCLKICWEFYTETWVASCSHCNTLQHTATHCNTLQHIATHCVLRCVAVCCSVLLQWELNKIIWVASCWTFQILSLHSEWILVSLQGNSTR